MLNKVYIAVSGCKRGFSVLYTSPGLDPAYTGVPQSLCDMRQYIRLTRPGLDFFAIDFIPGFRVCSIYRSTIDSAGSSGGFISVAMFIPDNLVVTDTRRILSTLLETYYSEYYNRQFATPLAGKVEQGANLEATLQSFAPEFSVRPLIFKPGMSDFNALPLYAAGCTEQSIDALFASPYHQAYLAGSKLIMLPAAIMAQPNAYGVAFNTDIRTIAIAPGLSDRLEGRMTAIVQQGCSITRFLLNSADFSSSYNTICLTPSDRITFTVLLPNGTSTSFDGTVKQALANRILLQSGNLFGFNFFPFDVALSFSGLTGGIPRENILIPSVVTASDVMPVTVNARGEGRFTVRAPFSNAALMLVAPDGTRVPINNNFISSSGDLRATYPVTLRQLTIRFPRIIKGKARLEINSARFPIDISPDPLTILLPANLNQPLHFCAGNNRWSVNPTSGVCTTDSRKNIPVWLWIVAVLILMAIGASLWFLSSNREKSENHKAVNDTLKDTTEQTSDNVDTTFTIGIDADGTLIDDSKKDASNSHEENNHLKDNIKETDKKDNKDIKEMDDKEDNQSELIFIYRNPTPRQGTKNIQKKK